MIFNENGFPRPAGATDFMDSTHLAGLMAFVGHEKMSEEKLVEYLLLIRSNDWGNQFVITRCPGDATGLYPGNYRNCSRDQLIPYVAGLKNLNLPLAVNMLLGSAKQRGYRAQNTERDVPGSTKKFPDGPDILDPSHIGYMKICAGLKANWFECLWMLARIKISSKFFPLKDPNNIIVMSIVYGYADILRKSNPRIAEAVRLYWGTWRNEPELAEMLIYKLENS